MNNPRSNSQEITKVSDKDSLRLDKFKNYFLNAIANDQESEINDIDLFCKERYEWMCQNPLNTLQIQCKEIKKETDSYLSLDIIHPDIPLLVMTIEEVLKKYHVSVSRIYHPILPVSLKKDNTLENIADNFDQAVLLSYCYIECNNQLSHQEKTDLIEQLQSHLHAVKLVHEQQDQLVSRVKEIQLEAKKHPTPLADFHPEWVALFDWLLGSDNFNFFGFAAFEISKDQQNEHEEITLLNEKSLGILDSSYSGSIALIKAVEAQAWQLRHYRSPYVFDIIKENSPVKRFEDLMRLSIKIPQKNSIIEYNFLGLLKRSSLLFKNTETPIIRLKIQKIFKTKNIVYESYDYNQIIRFMTSIPKFELFRTPTNHLIKMAEDLLGISNPNEVYVFSRKKIVKENLFLMVVIPPKIFTQKNIENITNYVVSQVPHFSVDKIEIHGDQFCRLHYHFSQPQHPNWEPDCFKLQEKLRSLLCSWEDQLVKLILKNYPGSQNKLIINQYKHAFPRHHQVRRTPEETLQDIINFEKLIHENELQFNVVPFKYEDSVLNGKVSILYFYNKVKMDLIDIMPVLENLEIHVYDQLTTRIGSKETPYGYIHAFRVGDKQLEKLDEEIYKPLLIDFLKAFYKGYISNDPLNGLLVKAQLRWQDINILKAYREWYLQLGCPYGKDKINQTILQYIESSKSILNYFETKFSLDKNLKNKEFRLTKSLPQLDQKFFESLHKVDDIASDVILKRLFMLVQATVRTNVYKQRIESDTYLSFKLDPSLAKHLPVPLPYKEIFVYDINMQGVHLRFGPASRGGIRWSDRQADFRKEVLELVKTQQTKNVVIVPVGSKGGFTIQKMPQDKNEAYQEGVKQYKRFISGLLDITDTIDSSGQIVHPDSVLIYDQKDPYLVVAADKGTAAFSDFANEVSESRNFWLGDAFASGGSKGYNHKDVGITARGAWECVKLHFQEQSMNCQTEVFKAIGIGDMSGDVFGNGMLLSKKTALIAAFNHIHIFLDPNPDTNTSFKERHRLYHLEKSSWQDYNPRLISAGGGVFLRKSKEINISKEIKTLLDIKEDVLNGEQLIRAILKAKTDLLWFGGIGTYIKCKEELNIKVGDPSNDFVRINVEDVRARVIGEGANLGITPLARMHLAKNGVYLNTDFIDNSAGVNMSDYEVNLKILFKKLIDDKKIASFLKRDVYLREIENDVTELVLKNNREKHRMISIDQIKSQKNIEPFLKLLFQKIKDGEIDPKSEVIPSQKFFDDLEQNKRPIPRPLLALIQAYTKMKVFDALLNSDLLAHSALLPIYHSYFPDRVVKDFKDELIHHHLQKEILATVICNRIINQAGILFFDHVSALTKLPFDQIAITYLVMDNAFEGDLFRKYAFQLSNTNLQYQAVILYEKLLLQCLQDHLSFDKLSLDDFETFKKDSLKIKKSLKISTKQLSEWINKGYDKISATILLQMMYLQENYNAFLIHKNSQLSVEDSLVALHVFQENFHLNWIKSQLLNLETHNKWENKQKESIYNRLNVIVLKLVSKIKNQNKLHDKKEANSELKNKVLSFICKNNYEQFKLQISDIKCLKNPTINMLTLLVLSIENCIK